MNQSLEIFTKQTTTLGQQIRLHQVANANALADAIAQCFKQSIDEAFAQRGQASVVLTGGSTPRQYYPQLAALDLPWAKLTFTLSDERWVEPPHELSNETLIRQHLLQGAAAAATLLPLKNKAASAQEGAMQASTQLAHLPHPYDLVLLGLGVDTHIASLFPNTEQFAWGVASDNHSRCIAITPPAGISPAVPRLSLTLNELLDSRRIVVAASGKEKLHALRTAFAGDQVASSPLPLLAQRAIQPVEIFWHP